MSANHGNSRNDCHQTGDIYSNGNIGGYGNVDFSVNDDISESYQAQVLEDNSSQTAILQDIVCAKYYASSTPPSLPPRRGECKIEPVQSEVAHINAWKDVFEALPGMSCATYTIPHIFY
jgi:hypothetical protein